jgi:MFS family permease
MPPTFKHLVTARLLFTIAVQMQAVILGWQMYILTADPLFLGLIGLSEAVPALGLAMYAGYLVDRGCPFTLYRRMILLSLLSGVVMIGTQIETASLSPTLRILGLFLASFLTGCARSFYQPTVFAMVPRLIDRELLTRGSAWMATTLQIGRVTGPALGGLIFAFGGMTITSLTICATIAAAYACTLSLPTLALSERGTTVTGSRKDELLMGARFVFKHPVLFPALSLDMISVLFGGVTALLPIYAAEVLRVGPTGLGALRASPAIGAAVVSLFLTSIDFRPRAGKWLFSAVIGFGVSIMVFALSESFVLSLIALAASGGFDSISVVIRSSAVQLSSPENMRGRISAINSMFIGSSNEIGEFESGVLARMIGVVPAAVFGGCACLLTVAAIALVYPDLRKLDLRKLE